MSTVATVAQAEHEQWVQPSKGRVAMLCLIIAESAIFTIFVVAYIYNIGRSLYGPTPSQVLDVPLFNTIALLSSSLTIWLSERAIEQNKVRTFGLWWGLTFVLGAIFLVGTGFEWNKLIYHDGLTISTNLFGTTFYSLVGLHASHVTIGLCALLIVLLFTITGHVKEEHAERIQVLALYWHFVDAVWIVVFTVVYIIGR
ncbi:heme-copper oxidase subunit III [Alloacidobacterium sp.]|uniref:cytochrome c oxidase subunit 3 n=1 Tax=Alloacidobacterium sp. TaxID=2951999 RepID=UPI002D485FB3|nr:heme-copper oxidase subunit III [Alloacidobacterium sp.]HYK35898.1 heme-copper oxidase subunit III [Alloacidobacterium sp.]